MKEALRVLFTSVMLVLLSGTAAMARTHTQTINLPANTSNVVFDDDDSDKPDVTARVARISFISGDARIKRVDGTDWETAKVNLPLVEGDEIATDTNGRVEIQLSSKLHLRLDHDSYLKFTTVADSGIALSLSQGTLSVRARDFNKDRSYLEIDAPKTTIAIQKSGTYRVDAGVKGDDNIRVAATDGGEARVYSDDAGFTLKSGRVAKVFIDGQRSGEWEPANVAQIADGFDQWTADRDAAVGKRLAGSYYGKYYDDDIYGADDLNDNGDWIYTADYGYVWRPYSSAVAGFSNWSPYRYGQWSWVQPYGWVWVNDEPWGWATYHYGRWVWANGAWVWSPYGYHRTTRSWWFPALVVIDVVATNIYWYPLPYHDHYCDFNWNYHHRDHDDRDHRGGGPGGDKHDGGPGGRGPRPIPAPGGIPPQATADNRDGRPDGNRNRPGGVPPGAVIGVESDNFGVRGRIRQADLVAAKRVLEREPIEAADIKLPGSDPSMPKGKRDVVSAPPVVADADRSRQTGAGSRHAGAPLDQELRNERILGGRPGTTGKPISPQTVLVEDGEASGGRRKTGAVERPVPKPPTEVTSNDTSTQSDGRKSPPVIESDRHRSPPIYAGPPQTGIGTADTGDKPKSDTVESKPPRESPRPKPVEREPTPQVESPPERVRPRPEPPARNDPPQVREQPRNDPPPQRQPEPKRETPPTPKETPKSEPKTEPPLPRKKDGN